MKPFTEFKFKIFQKQTKVFAKKIPLHVVALVVIAIMILYWVLNAFELLPETTPMRLPQGMVVEQGDSLSWLDMKVIQLTRSLKKEFKVPGKIKGMFVLDEGLQQAKKYGVKTGDVIVALGRKPVPTARAFADAANQTQYQDGILLDIYRDGNTLYITIPFEYQYGPLMGPNQGSWQLGAPVFGKVLPYGPVVR